MEYTHNVLWQWNNGVLILVTFGFQQRNDPFAPAPEVQAIDLQYKIQERATIMSHAIATGMRHATMTSVDRQSEMAYIDNARLCSLHPSSVSHSTRNGGLPVIAQGSQEPLAGGAPLPKW